MSQVLIGMVGDLLIDRECPGEALEAVTDLLAGPDVLFGNLEASFSDEPHAAPSAAIGLFPAAHNLDAFARAGFHVLSMANNHICDAGHAAMLENRARLRSQGVKTCGAGVNISDARRPAIVDTKGVSIAFLGYASVFPMGYEARSNVPGLVPARAYDLWRPGLDNYHVPGTPPRTHSVRDESDFAAIRKDICAAKQQADLVAVSFHWGDWLRPYHLTEHETQTARWCIEQGADLVIGHHHHALRGIEWYRGRPIFYGLGHFVFDLRLNVSDELKAEFSAMPPDARDYSVFPREGWPLLPLHPDTRMTLMAWASVGSDGVSEIGFVPCRLRPDGSVAAVDPASEEGKEVLAYVERCIVSQKLNGRICTDRARPLAGRPSVCVVEALSST